MTFAPSGYPAMAVTATLAIGTLAASVWRRSWMLWLAGVALLIVTAVVAWGFRTSPPGPTAAEPTGAPRPLAPAAFGVGAAR